MSQSFECPKANIRTVESKMLSKIYKNRLVKTLQQANLDIGMFSAKQGCALFGSSVIRAMTWSQFAIKDLDMIVSSSVFPHVMEKLIQAGFKKNYILSSEYVGREGIQGNSFYVARFTASKRERGHGSIKQIDCVVVTDTGVSFWSDIVKILQGCDWSFTACAFCKKFVGLYLEDVYARNGKFILPSTTPSAAQLARMAKYRARGFSFKA
ncbi:MAG: hypothetical protein KAS12_06515 [Candidatus Aenigmarchaeota archaeon]|nr:hypothetical protein [Candidatus Aenigmarchaeota archaeon]